MSAVFVSYRRNDTAGEAGRLVDTLNRDLGRTFAFRDVVSIAPGDRWDTELENQVAVAKVVLALIGPAWLRELENRAHDPGADFVHAELLTALRTGKRVIPVLVRGAALPSADDLPADLRDLTRCQTMTLRDESWAGDVVRLIDAIGRPYRWGRLGLRVLIAIVLVFLIAWKVVPVLLPSVADDYRSLRLIVISLLLVYAGAELAAYLLATHSRARVMASS